ncbi:hypothetical protein G6F37_000470 [Rhizopus arrhizus]|nr:hypothetical protein G6F38_002435 [Rhizopus arrhizus]KAG1164240.1 hypothetical protein G6F37_000470 [Rhizopus arrhizus]
MFQYSNITHSPVNNNEPIKIADFQQVTTSYPTHYHYDPEFYHQSTTTPWQQTIYPEVPPTDYAANNQVLTKPRITTSVWDDEGTVCYQVDVRSICVARRQDNDMINGTKLLNVTGMSRGKRDGILKNEKGRVVVKVGAMHLKGVWVTFARAKALAIQYSIIDYLHPLFVDDPAMFFYSNQLTQNNYFTTNHPIYLQSQDSLASTNTTQSRNNSITTTITTTTNNNNNIIDNNHNHNNNTTAAELMSVSSSYPMINESLMNYPLFSDSSDDYYLANPLLINDLLSAPSVPSMLPVQYSTGYYS